MAQTASKDYCREIFNSIRHQNFVSAKVLDSRLQLSTFVATDFSRSYVEKAQKLRELAARRDALRKKVETYRHLQRLLDPLKDPSTSVQPNLVTRDGELAAELGRCKALGIRISSRLPDLPDRDDIVNEDVESVDDLGLTDGEKLAQVMNIT